MTRDEILKMPAGREMDEQVGYIVYPDAKKRGFIVCPKYSTDIKDAWEVYEKLISDCKSNNGEPDFFMLNAYHAYPERGWYIAKIWAHHDGDIVEFELTAPSAPLAICRAALLAVEAV